MAGRGSVSKWSCYDRSGSCFRCGGSDFIFPGRLVVVRGPFRCKPRFSMQLLLARPSATGQAGSYLVLNAGRSALPYCVLLARPASVSVRSLRLQCCDIHQLPSSKHDREPYHRFTWHCASAWVSCSAFPSASHRACACHYPHLGRCRSPK